jgi:predicted amidohydrolase
MAFVPSSNWMRSATIEKIGFFHCVRFAALFDPVSEVREAIDKRIEEERRRDQAWDISNSLIVLPEAFNIGDYVSRSVPNQLPQEFLEGLRKLAERHGVLFVTGIVDGRRNSAYLIDSEVAHLMCHKIGDDRTGVYDPCTGNPDPCNPIAVDNGCVGTLICMDATSGDSQVRYRRERLLSRLKACDGHKVVCVPARFHRECPDLLTPLPKVSRLWYAVADGSWKMGRSDSRIMDSSLQRKVEANDRNEIAIWQLP